MRFEKRRKLLLLAATLFLSANGSVLAQTGGSTNFLFGPSTGSQAAVFATFVASDGNLDSALSISNVLAAPATVQEVFFERFHNLEGTLEFYFWDADGTLYVYETQPDSPGAGLDAEGALHPGQTYRVLLSELLDAAGFDRERFTGYAWILGNFDGVQGTVTVTDFANYTNSYAMQPDLGSSLFERDAQAGIPLVPPIDY